MIKKLLLVFVVLFLAACHTQQTVVRTTKPAYKRPTNSTASSSSKKKPASSNSKGVTQKSAPKSPQKAVSKTPPSNNSKAPAKTSTPTVVVAQKPVISKPEVVQSNEDSLVLAEIKKIEQKYESAKEENKSSGNNEVYSKTEILEATTRVKVTTAMILDYINQYKPIAQSNMRDYGIPASIILGQGILESGSGTGPLCLLANNHFGIKCHKDWNGPSIRYDDDEEQECFRKYDQSMDSYRDHALFLLNRKWYAPLFELEKDDYKEWARGLKRAGYATDPKYPEKLIAIIERYQLNQYDAEVLGKDFTPINTSSQISPKSDSYQVGQGDTLYSISKKFNISVDDLRRKNNLQDNALSIGQNLIVK